MFIDVLYGGDLFIFANTKTTEVPYRCILLSHWTESSVHASVIQTMQVVMLQILYLHQPNKFKNLQHDTGIYCDTWAYKVVSKWPET